MAGEDYGWSITVPGDSVTIGSLPGHIRDAKNTIRSRAEKEHTLFVGGTETTSGMNHREGSAVVYRQDAEPTARPAETPSISLTIADDGRLWADSNDSNSLYVYDGSGTAWVAVAIAGMDVATAEGTGSTVLGDKLALLPGRTGGQTLLGGTGSGDALNLGGSSHADEGPINVIAADTTLVELNEVPVHSLKLGEAMNANSKKITGLASAAAGTQTQGMRKK